MIEIPPRALPERPYRGIDFFRFVDQPIFFAREQETQKLIRLVTIYRGSLCFGDSGSGKSSLINAGLIPELLVEDFLPERIRVQAIPGKEFRIEQIALTEDGKPPFLPSRFVPQGGNATRLVELPAAGLSAHLPLDSSEEGAANQGLGYPLLIFDQFEELVTLFEEAPESREQFAEASVAQQAIINVLVSLLRPTNPKSARLVKLLFVFRDDYLAKLSKLFTLIPNLRDQHLRLTTLMTSALPKIIRGPFETKRIPAGHFTHEISPPLAEKLAAAIDERSESGLINLTEVQIACSTLWSDPNRDRAFDGGTTKREVVQRLLERYLEGALEQLGKDRAVALTILSNLVTNSGTRNIVSEDDLLIRVTARDQVPVEIAKRTLRDLVGKTRLVRRQRRYETAFYDIASEFLVPWIRAERLRRDAAYAAEERAKAGRARMRNVLLGLVVLALGVAGWGWFDAKQQRDRAESEAKKAVEATLKAEDQLARADAATAAVSRDFKELQEQLAKLKTSQETAAAASKAQTTAGEQNQHASELLARFIDQAKLSLSPSFMSQLKDLQLALGKATETAKSGAEASIKAVEATNAATTQIEKAVSETKLVAVLEGHKDQLRMVEFSTSGGLVVTASKDKTARVWDRSGALRKSFIGSSHDGVRCASFDPGEKRIVTGSDGSTVRIHDLETGRTTVTYEGHTDTITSAWFSPDGKSVVSSSADKTVQIWDPTSAATAYKFTNHNGIVTYARFDRTGNRVISSGDDHLACVWNIANGTTLWRFNSGAPVKRADFSSDGKWAVAAGFKSAMLWNTGTGNQDERFEHAAPILQALLSPDSKKLATVGIDGTANIWTVEDRERRVLVGHSGPIRTVAWSPDSRRILTGSDDRTARLWDAENGAPLLVLDGHTGAVTWVAYSPRSDLVATASADATARLWNPNAKPDVKPQRPANIVWAYYGMRNDDGTWTRYFKKTSGDENAVPASGDELVALNAVTIRKDVIRLLPGKGFVNADAIGVLKPKKRIKVIEVRGPNDEDPGNWNTIWITFDAAN